MDNSLLQTTPALRPYRDEELSLENAVHIFLIRVDEHFPKVAFSPILSQEEREKAARFFHQKDRESYIVSKHYLRVILGRFLGIKPSGITYAKTGNKKPSLPGIEFNLSHSNNLVVIAVSQQPVGIDTEDTTANFEFNEILDTCFNEEERSFILKGAHPLLNFYTLWTRKEAFLKATGEGLKDELYRVPSLFPELRENGACHFIQTYLTEYSYLISLATQNPAAPHTYFWKFLR